MIVAGYQLTDLTGPGATAGQAGGGWVSCSAWMVARVQAIDGIIRTLTCPVVRL